MGKFLESWIHAHRLARAAVMAVFAGGLLIWLLWFGPPERVALESQDGQVVSVADGGVAEIELQGGQHVRVMTKLVLKPGERVPMMVETYKDGSIVATVDEHAWRMR